MLAQAIEQAVVALQQGYEDAFETLAVLLGDDIAYKSHLNTYWVPGYDAEDLEQEMLLVLYQTAKSYDPALAGFRTYFWKAVEYRIRVLQRDASSDKRKANTEAFRYGGAFMSDEDEGKTFDIEVTDDGYEMAEILAEVSRWMEPHDQFIIVMKAAGYENRVINRMLGWKEYIRPDGSYARCEVDRRMVELKKRCRIKLQAV